MQLLEMSVLGATVKNKYVLCILAKTIAMGSGTYD
jgi:hypothetical protein